jgi:hypothetical protein
MKRGQEYEQPQLPDIKQIQQDFVNQLTGAEQGSIRREEAIDHTNIMKLVVKPLGIAERNEARVDTIPQMFATIATKLRDANYRKAFFDNEPLRQRLRDVLRTDKTLQDENAIVIRMFDELKEINKLAVGAKVNLKTH